ncbi:DNA replication and repair protein RecF [Myxococcota bacterium]|nr:DNA replication and repair protein RecF [Myxococcota bacterium]MBU1537092.1 DNA replication and repair protein RecF [Myxococcota bacterium]
MKLLSFEAINFRNIAHCTFTPHEVFSFIHGNNGQGKTNLMEALHLLFTLRPIRTGNDIRPLLMQGAEYFSLRAQVDDLEGSHELFFSFSRSGAKKLILDGVEATPREFLTFGPVMFFSPDQAALIVESPEVRRRAIDRSVFHVEPSFYELLAQFKGTLKRRNSILKMDNDPRLLASIDRSFAPLAFEVSRRRRQFIEALAPYFSAVWAVLKPSIFPMSISFFENLGNAQGEEELYTLLRNASNADFQRKTSLLGPQREDLHFLVEEKSSKFFVSHGERKIAALAFIIACIQLIREKSGRVPLFLLDDLAAELDTKTRELVLSYLDHINLQIVMTGIFFPWETNKEGRFLTINEGVLSLNESGTRQK